MGEEQRTGIGKALKAGLADRLAKQVGALCYRKTGRGGKEVLLVTSRNTGRWIIPKGWCMAGKPDHAAAEQEAWEEAGVRTGRIRSRPIGVYDYHKTLEDGETRPCRVSVYPLEVEKTRKDFPEAEERTRRWVSPDRAAKLVQEPKLKRILRDF